MLVTAHALAHQCKAISFAVPSYGIGIVFIPPFVPQQMAKIFAVLTLFKLIFGLMMRKSVLKNM